MQILRRFVKTTATVLFLKIEPKGDNVDFLVNRMACNPTFYPPPRRGRTMMGVYVIRKKIDHAYKYLLLIFFFFIEKFDLTQTVVLPVIKAHVH